MSDKNKEFQKRLIDSLIGLALEEDKIWDDVTTNGLLDYDAPVAADVTAKEAGVISGTGVFKSVFQRVDPEISIRVFKGDGLAVKKGDLVLRVEGLESSILKGERTALNFLQRLSGVATSTRNFAKKLRPFGITLLDTRKTTPGMRYLEKKAVLDGGGSNHRMNLEEMAMVKDNHIEMAGSIANAVKAIREIFPDKMVEVEVKNLMELDEALAVNADLIMLDNFSPDLLKKAVTVVTAAAGPRGRRRLKLEVSGNVALENIEKKAKACVDGVEFISVGALTHSFKSLDLSLNIVLRGSRRT
ncbi:MAG: carboxylating nicotinate-nucleotide diphosphorylase [bacterium]|nr:carboxylating nicotinate-nucleotide diphosphorylase [bacterium]